MKCWLYKKKKKIVHMRLKRWLPFWNVGYVYKGENDFYFRKEHVINKITKINKNILVEIIIEK